MSAPVDPPETPPAAAEPTAPPAPPAAGPWAADLAEYFGDNHEAIAAADRYMRERVQPTRTQFEMETAPARELYKDLVEDPQSTLKEVIDELYGSEMAEQFAAIFADPPSGDPEPTTPPPSSDVPEWAKPLVERDQAQREREAQEAADAAYTEALAELRTNHADLTDDDMELIHPFIASAQGDMEQGYAGFNAWKEKWVATHGSAPVADPTPTAPPVLGAEGTAAATPPVATEYKSFDDAWDAWQAEKAVTPPPVVGSA